MANDQQAERRAQFQAAMAKQAAPSAAPAQAATTPPTAAPPPEAVPAEPQTDTPPADGGTPPAPSRWKRKIKALDEEKELDLEAMSEEELDTLLGRGLAHETIKERLRAQRDAAQESVEKERERAAAARDQYWQGQLVQHGYVVRDPVTGAHTFVPPQAQTASAKAPAAGQTDLDALEKRALEENTAETWAAYTRAIRQSVGTPLTQADVDRVVSQRLAEGKQELVQERQKDQAAKDFDRRFRAAFDAKKATFAKLGDVDAIFKAVQKDAYARSCVPNADESFVLGAISERAEAIERAMQAAQAQLAEPTKPRAKAPSVVPSGGAPASIPTNPASFDRSTPEGRKKAIEFLQRQMDAKRNARLAPSVV